MMMQVVAKTDTAETKVDPGPRLINRELSWLDASERVLDLAAGRPGRRRDLSYGSTAWRDREYVHLSRSSPNDPRPN